MDDVPDSEGASLVVDHAYESRGAWWSVCVACGLAEAAHRRSTQDARQILREIYGTDDDANTNLR